MQCVWLQRCASYYIITINQLEQESTTPAPHLLEWFHLHGGKPSFSYVLL
ncbi:hypothetical protein [Alteribacillus bidgolensis]|nr:hypothetical protein [Alteribacillus bidgolensis]